MANNLFYIFESFLPEKAGSTLTVALYVYAKERGEFDIAFAIAVILMVLTFIINLSAKFAGKALRKRKENNGEYD